MKCHIVFVSCFVARPGDQKICLLIEALIPCTLFYILVEAMLYLALK